ncbi:MAG: tyrosine-type recombinase/integrase [Terriglobales bacterium]
MNRFEQFLRERTYLSNVSPRTIEWHEQSLKWLTVEQPTECDLKAIVMNMREAGLKPSSINCRLRSINAYLKWSGSALKVPKLKEPQKIVATYSPKDIAVFIAYKPKHYCEQRLQCLLLTLADTGTRISELLGLRWEDVNFDYLLITVKGKGDKSRTIPFSLELRRYLYRLQQKSKHSPVFAARNGNRLGRRNVLRDLKNLCERLRVNMPERALHAFRHSFAVNYLRRGGSVFHLQKALGHSSLEMTRRYANLMTEDLQKIHQKVSLLSAAL